MRAATRVVWEVAGRPSPVASTAAHLRDAPGTCAICAELADFTADFDKSLGANFTDRSLIRAQTSRVCAACLWCCSGKPPATLRMWSVVAAPGESLPESQPKAWLQGTAGLCLTNRASTRPIIDMLAAPPVGNWVVTVAVSGQKHVVPYAVANSGSGRWTVRVEDHNVTATPGEWARAHGLALALRRLGVPAECIPRGEPRFIKTQAALTQWRALDQDITPWKNSPVLTLALWTITKEVINDAHR